MPPEVSRRARALLSGEWQPPPVRDASTVVLLRDGEVLETYLMRRAATMAFAAGMYVFPGGRIDESDSQIEVSWAGTVPDGERMTATESQARGLVVGAVREVFEETGVLLAVDSSGRTPTEDAEWEADRARVAGSSAAFADVLERRELRLDADLLPLWTHWITPEIESKRYDVRFFVAAVPVGQSVADVSGEADHVSWMAPADALQEYARGALPMLPPTVATLADLASLPDVSVVLASASAREIRPLMPRPRLDDAGALAWEVVDVRDGSVVVRLPSEPAGSEVAGA
ncbi:MAG: NUDIX hydrolase [Candidatus Nanopelagicales bacterium]